jgi:hypothetical protein
MASERVTPSEDPLIEGTIRSAAGHRPLPHRALRALPARLAGGAAPAHSRGGEAPPWVYRVLIALLVAGMIGFSIAPITRCVLGQKNKDYPLWYKTGRIVLAGGTIYPRDQREFPFMYPPAAAALLGVASAGGELPLVIGLIVINSAAWIAAVLLSVYLATGRALRQHPLLYAFPTLCVIPFIHDTYLLGQPNLLLLALMLGAFACLRRGRQAAAGSLIALAAGLKAFPILAVGYLIYRCRWKALGAVAAGLLALLLVLPMAFLSPASAADDLVTWTRGMVLKYDDGGIAQRPARSLSFKNQSLVALANRLLRPVPANGEAKETWKVNVADLDFRAVNAVILASVLGLCLFYVRAMPRGALRTEQTDAIEWAMLLILILFFSPLAFNYFYVWLIYPFAVALRLVLTAPLGSRARRDLLAWIVTVVGVFALALVSLRTVQAYGNLFFAALLLLIGLGVRMRQLAAAPVAA